MNASGVATFTYAGTVPGADVLQAIAIGGTATLASSTLSVSWTAAQSGPNGVVSQGWIGSPAQRARVEGLVPVTVDDVPMRATRPKFCALANEKLARLGVTLPDWRDALRRSLDVQNAEGT